MSTEQHTAHQLAQSLRAAAQSNTTVQFLTGSRVEQQALIKRCSAIDAADLTPLQTSGLAHDHWHMRDTGLLLRVPRQSQMGLSAAHNLQYQTACFVRMQGSKHTPVCHAVFSPTAQLPMGALLVQRIAGRPPQDESDFPAIAQALAAIHRLPVPDEPACAPLRYQHHSMQCTLAEVEAQAKYLPVAGVDLLSLSMIQAELATAKNQVAQMPPPPVCLISFDAHPGNFLIEPNGKAVLVDLEKGRYGGCGFDLAHASLYTSTTWDTSASMELSYSALIDFYRHWSQHVPDNLATAMQRWQMPMRRLMWLWAVTWCAMWQVKSREAVVADKHQRHSTRDWAAGNNPDQLTDHVQERVTHYLQPTVISAICEEFEAICI